MRYQTDTALSNTRRNDAIYLIGLPTNAIVCSVRTAVLLDYVIIVAKFRRIVKCFLQNKRADDRTSIKMPRRTQLFLMASIGFIFTIFLSGINAANGSKPNEDKTSTVIVKKSILTNGKISTKSFE